MKLSQLIQRQPPFLQRAAAVTVLCAVCVGVGLIVFEGAPWAMNAQSQWRESARSELSRARGWANSDEVVRRQEAALKNTVAWGKLYVTQDGVSVPDRIQNDVTAIVNASGAAGANFETFNVRSANALDAHGVRVTASYSADQLQTVLAAIREHAPYLRLQRIEVTAPQIEAHFQNPVVLAVMELVGYSQKTGSAANGSRQ